ncbi:MAG: Ig-like domain-containing protein, partial [Gallionella sp.]|nr:Ig-like domain-containing protein [Gallionella sp.]
ATVDASKLNSGEDKIYFTGNWVDYSKAATASKITFTNATTGETVIVAAATGASNDRLVFADGYVLSNDAKTALLANASAAISAVTGFSTAELTPLPGPTVTITTNDNALMIGDAATLTFTLSEVPGNATTFAVGDVVATGGILSGFSGSGTSYTATFTPDVNSTTAATVSVAGGAFSNAAGQNNVAAQQLSMTVDTLAPTAATSAPTAAAGPAINAAEATAGVAVVASLAGTGAVAGDSLELRLGGASFGTPQVVVLTANDITAGSYTFTVASGTLGADGTKSLTSVVIDAAGNVGVASPALALSLEAAAPTLNSIAIQTPANATTNADTLVYRATFSESVSNVDTADFAVTGSTATVTSVSVAGTNAYDVTVSGGNLAALDGTVTLGFAGTQNIADAASNALVTPTATASYTLDNTAPTAASGAPTATAGPTINATEATAGVAVAASLAGTNAVTGDTIELKLGGASFSTPLTHVLTAGEVTAGSYTFTVASGTLGADGAKSLTSVVTDAAGNVGAASPALALTLDATAPLAAASAATAVAGPIINATEAAAGFAVVVTDGTGAVAGDTLELLLNGASFATPLTHVLTAQEAVGSYTFTVASGTLGANGSKSLSSRVIDQAGNVGSASPALVLTLDTAAPTLTSIATQSPASTTTNADTLVYRATFGEAVSNVDATDFAVTGTTATVTSVTVAGTNAYDVTVSGGNLAGLNGSVTLGFAGAQNITDAGGNALVTPTATVSYTVSNTAPLAANSAPAAAAGPVINSAEATAGVALVATVTGTNAVAGDTVELKLGGASFSTPLTHVLTAGEVIAGSYTFTVASGTLGADGAKSLTSVVTDAAGNVGAASPALALTLDTAAPLAASASPTAAAGPAINAAEALAGVSVVASLSGTGAAAGDTIELKLGGASFGTPLTHVLIAGEVTAGSYTFTVASGTLGADGAKSLTSVVTDAAGNVGAASPALALSLEAMAPTLTSLTIQTPASATTNADTLVYRATFSESVSNVDATDFAVTGSTATVTSVSVAGTNAYDVTVSGGNLAAVNGTVTLGFAGSQNIADAAANALVTPATTASYTLDNTPPTAANGAPTAAAGPTITAAEAAAGVVVVATLAGTNAVAGDTIELKLGGASFTTPLTHVLTAGEVTAGSYTFTVASGTLGADGAKSLTSVVTDASGNVGAASPALALTLSSAQLTYGTTTFNEAAANDGSITATSTITLSGDTFVGTNAQVLTGAVVTNVPVGLTAVVTKTSDTTATLSFTGSAAAHDNANDIANLTVTMSNSTFTGGNASVVADASKSNLVVNFANTGAIIAGDGAATPLNGTAADNIIYGGGGADIINGGAGIDTIDITDAGVSVLSSASIVFTSAANGTDTIVGFSAAALASGGDKLDFSAIVNLTDSVATGQTLTTNFAANNVFVFDGTPVTITAAASAIAADVSVVATDGYIVIADSANNNAVTVYHSTSLDTNGTETALAVLSGVNIVNLTAANFVV